MPDITTARLEAAVRRRDQGLAPYPNDNLVLSMLREACNPNSFTQPPAPKAGLKRDILELLTINPHGLTVERIWQILHPSRSALKITNAMWGMYAEGYPILSGSYGFWTYRPEGHVSRLNRPGN